MDSGDSISGLSEIIIKLMRLGMEGLRQQLVVMEVVGGVSISMVGFIVIV